MNISFKGLVVVASILGFACSAYAIPICVHSQSQQAYTIANTKPGGGPRLPILGSSTGIERLTSVGDTQTN